MERIVIVEDDIYMRKELADVLNKSGYEVVQLTNFEDSVNQILSLSPDLVLLDINLPYLSGFDICKALKQLNNILVLVLTARDKLKDELHALGLGADDYLIKPCNIERLLARIKNLLRRKTIPQNGQNLLDGGDFLLDSNTYTIYTKNKSYLLPPNEGKILLALLSNSPNVVEKKDLCLILWGTNKFIDENALQVNLTRLRKHLCDFGLESCIETVRGRGYRLKDKKKI